VTGVKAENGRLAFDRLDERLSARDLAGGATLAFRPV
jgi:hypothetical protein